MAFKVFLAPGDQSGRNYYEFSNDDSYELLAGGALKVTGPNTGTFLWSPITWVRVEDDNL
jgi:hypothetical protein